MQGTDATFDLMWILMRNMEVGKYIIGDHTRYDTPTSVRQHYE